MPNETYTEVLGFSVANDHPNCEAQQWLADRISCLDLVAGIKNVWKHDLPNPVLTAVDEQDPGVQISLLKACLERMNWHAAQPSDAEGIKDAHFYVGSLLYRTVCTLYQRDLPYSEHDICGILTLSQHSCGHGSDVGPPFEIALAHARKNGISDELLAALRTYLGGLKGTRSIQANQIKRKVNLLLVLESGFEGKARPCWSDRFRKGLALVSQEEQQKWRELVVSMTVQDAPTTPKKWHRRAKRFLDDVSAAPVIERLSAWWPDPRESTIWPIQTGGSHLLKYFIGLLSLIREAGTRTAECDSLVCQLSEIGWKPRDRGQKVILAAVHYLLRCPPEVAGSPLERLESALSSEPDRKRAKARELLQSYRNEHDLRLA